jgi:hypothetical protein
MMRLISGLAAIFLLSCTKDQGVNPALAYSDKALLDSCRSGNHFYYKNSSALIPSAGPHGDHALRLNSKALQMIGPDGKLRSGGVMPEGALIIKDVYDGSALNLYALMYKKSGSWLWAEIKPSGEVVHSVNSSAQVCTGCHSGASATDDLFTFR